MPDYHILCDMLNIKPKTVVSEADRNDMLIAAQRHYMALKIVIDREQTALRKLRMKAHAEQTAIKQERCINMSTNAINPSHYTQTKIEPIEVIEDWKLNFNLGSAIKYIARREDKGTEKEDLLKAANYIYREATGKWLPKELEEYRPKCNQDEINDAIEKGLL